MDESYIDVSKFKQYEQRQHIYDNGDTELGGTTKYVRKERLMEFEPELGIVEKKVSLPPACERIYLEIISNSGDNVSRSLQSNLKVTSININMTDTTITVRNDGIPIPVKMHPEYNIWVPEMVFGHLRTSVNYDKDEKREVAGKNGYGAKLTNIFSTRFKIEVGDNRNGKKYTQIWKNNMIDKSDPVIKDYKGKSYVKVEYDMDFKRFEYDDKYPPEALKLFAAHAADLSFTCGIPVIFNKTRFNFRLIKHYSKLFFSGDAKSFTYQQDGNQLMVIDTPDKGKIISFVNGIITRDGGVHVDDVFKSLSTVLLSKYKKDTARNKMNRDDLKRHVSIILACRLDKPKFSGQTKSKLISPKPMIEIPKPMVSRMTKWSLSTRLDGDFNAKNAKLLIKTDGKKTQYVSVKKLSDANDAGKPGKSKDCTLFITEGDSAKNYAVNFYHDLDGGNDKHGAYPIRGKMLNVMNASDKRIAENKEIVALKKILGIKEGLDYSEQKNLNKLRYGKLAILADSDVDGMHIVGLLLNVFHCRFVSLLKAEFISFVRTPIIRVWKGTQNRRFYNEGSYRRWAEKEDVSKWRYKYYKGLGSSEKKDIADDVKNHKMVTFTYNNRSHRYFRLAFDHNLSNLRKVWLSLDHNKEVTNASKIKIRDFIDNEFVQYSIENLTRSIPGMDGLKESQRKIIWASLKKWGASIGKKDIKEMKTVRLASHISEYTHYRHGETSLCDAINLMVLSYAGSNNLPYFAQKGLFGTRLNNGKDAASPRYTFTHPEWWWLHIFKKEDLIVYDLAKNEGQLLEPKTFLPIIPLGIINGGLGVATGYSTFIPNHNPDDVINWILDWLNGDTTKTLKPWYKGFKGSIEVKTTVRPIKSVNLNGVNYLNQIPDLEEDDSSDSPEKELDESSNEINMDDERVENNTITKSTMIVKGHFEKDGDKVVITELPIRRSISSYIDILEKMRCDDVIRGYRNMSNSNDPHFEVIGMKKPTHKKLSLVQSIGVSNIVVLDSGNKPQTFGKVDDLMEYWVEWRLPFYVKRKELQISAYLEKIKNLKDKIKFVESITNGKLSLWKKSKDEIKKQMDKLNLEMDLVKNTTIYNCTKDELSRLNNELKFIKSDYEKLLGTDPKDIWTDDLTTFRSLYKNHN